MTADEIIRRLNLRPHPEGGYYRETYRSAGTVPGAGRAGRPRVYSTGIYYLLVPGAVSKMHRLEWDEMFHFYLGDPVTWVLLAPGGGVRRITLGNRMEEGQEPQMVAPAGTWFGGSLEEGGQFALMGTTVAPGFEFEDFTLGRRSELLALFPQAAGEITRLT